ncbi:uncharacterized protein LOC130805586 [Amaranthus tricolor]|uniref:uncharacterized protein LOC130805586 n=1 Tax=Amaranthus tricolor TaxID=29722 RepID=UPI00258AD754|nr:uncharacterized protein LOC130805586 [Amaranthus tricolor]
MTEITKRLFNILDLIGQKFLKWKEDAIMNIEAQGLEQTVLKVKEWNPIDGTQATKIKVIFPQASHEWKNLRFSDFKTLSEYNSILYRIASMLKYCEHPVIDAEMIELTLSTFHPSNIILQQQYWERNFKRYSDLSVVLSLAEKHNDLVWKNHNMRPIGSQTIRETHSTKTHVHETNAVENKARGNYNNRGG